MTKMDKGLNSISLKYKNQALILEKIKQCGSISRAELSKQLGLSAPSISKNIELLLEKGIILETGIGESSGGRKPIVLEYNYDYCYIVALALKEDKLTSAISNLKGDIIFEYKIEKDFSGLDKGTILSEIDNSIKVISDNTQILLSTVKCIVISLPGIVDDNIVKVSNIFPQLQGELIKDYMLTNCNIDIQIKNDINSKAIGEYWKLPEASYNNIVYISPEKTGVGSGIIIDGKLYEGSRFGAGEIGYMLLDEKCLLSGNCKKSYLENIVSNRNILKYAFELSSEKGGYIKQKTKDDFSNMTIRLLKEAIELKDEVAIEVLGLVSRYFTISIHNTATILNPDVVLLGGMFIELGTELFEQIRSYLEAISIIPIDIRLSEIDEMAQLYGSIYFGINYINKKILDI